MKLLMSGFKRFGLSDELARRKKDVKQVSLLFYAPFVYIPFAPKANVYHCIQ